MLEPTFIQATLPYPAPSAKGLDPTACQAIIHENFMEKPATCEEHHITKIDNVVCFFFFLPGEIFKMGRSF